MRMSGRRRGFSPLREREKDKLRATGEAEAILSKSLTVLRDTYPV